MAQQVASRSHLRIIWSAVAVALVLIFFGVRTATRSKLPIRAAAAERGELKSTISTNGKIEPQLNFEAHAPFPGVIKALYVHEGDKVPHGKLLLAMDDADARSKLATALAGLRGAQAACDAILKGGTQEERLSLRSEVAKAQVDNEQAQKSYVALQKLQLAGSASAAEVAAAKGRVDATSSALQVLEQRRTSRYDAGDLTHAKAALADAQAAYDAALQTVERANVRAPFAGSVYSLPASSTEFVQQGDRVLQMANLSKVQVRAYFDEPEIGKLQGGLPITIVWDAKPNERWHGHISHVPSTIISYGTRNVGEVLATIDDPDGSLLPSTNVTVTVTTGDRPNVLSVPREALHTESGKAFVYRISGDTLRRVPVQVGNINLTQVEILSGLQEGDRVALGTTNGQPIADGVPVTVIQ